LAGIYLHIPLCRQACFYCDFHFSTYLKLKPELIESIKTELILQKKYLQNESIDTIYFGGGTPSILEIHELEELLEVINSNYTIDVKSEITLESNPDDLNEVKTRDLKQIGFNRLSIGVQSFDDKTLQFLHRVHNSRDSINAIINAEKAGFNNINLDLIFAISEKHGPIIKGDINHIINIQPQHVSAYSLTIEPKTVFGNWSRKGK
jgi:oxygen-independent coproporphyrinogen-3 oxidase